MKAAHSYVGPRLIDRGSAITRTLGANGDTVDGGLNHIRLNSTVNATTSDDSTFGT